MWIEFSKLVTFILESVHNFCSRKLEIQREGGELNWVQRVCQKFGVKKII